MSVALDHSRHTAYSDPGDRAAVLNVVPRDPEALSSVARNVIVHYRASGHELPRATRDDVNARWLQSILDTDQRRHPQPLDVPRAATERVQGCCRDHTLFCVGVLRSHGVPARSRVGFAGYFVDGWHHDHVIVEAFIDGRWRRFDPEVDVGSAALPNPLDIEHGRLDGPGFVTAAQVWLGYRRGDIDADTYGVDPDQPVFRGERFIFEEVIYEIAHRFGDELLLWDTWGRMGEPGSPVTGDDAGWIDDVARLLVAADGGDHGAEQRLYRRYRDDLGLRPGPTVIQASPYGDPPIEVALDR
ncbi:MAG: transglutaminase domain-containing protein [Acidimicrobiales bacterium]